MKVFVSNSLSSLAESLYHSLFIKDSPLQKKWVVIPHENVKTDLYLKWLEKTDVITGIKVITYHELLSLLFPLVPSRLELTLRLHIALDEILLPPAIASYLSTGKDKKRQGLIQEISTLFLHYLKMPEDALTLWLQKEGWQQSLWRSIFPEEIPTKKGIPLNGHFFFYNIATVSSDEYALFAKMHTEWFLFSPSEMFLGDLKTKKQQQKLLKKAPTSLHQELLFYFAQDPPLLSNWKEVCQKQCTLFEEEKWKEDFKAPATSSMLHTLQLEWLTLERSHTPPDTSLQIHSAPTKLREVEAVWEVIHQSGNQGKDVLVLAPDIDEYASLIQFVFLTREGSFDYTIHGVKEESLSPSLEGLKLLLTLPEYRFSREVMEKLLVNTPFLTRLNMTLKEGEELTKWMRTFELRSQLDEGQGKDFCKDTGSWNGALKRAVESLVTVSCFDTSLEWTDTTLLSQWITLKEEMLKHLYPLSQEIKQSALEWEKWLYAVIDTFFDKEVLMPYFQKTLRLLRMVESEHLFPYSAIEPLIRSVFEARSGKIPSKSLEAITFTSFTSGSLTSAKTVIIMGMEEGSFPRKEPASSLAQLPLPSKLKEAQDALMKALASTQEQLIITYTRCHIDDGKVLNVCPLVEELQKDRGNILTLHHPHSSLDPSYFQGSELQSLSHTHYTLTAHPFSQSPLEELVLLPPSFKPVVSIQAIKKLARHPFKFFLHERLGVRFFKEEEGREFVLPPYVLYPFKEKGHPISLEELTKELEQQGKLPIGSFKDAALLAIKQEIADYQEALEAFCLTPSSFMTIVLSPYCKTPYLMDEKTKVIPSLTLTLKTGEKVQIEGTLEGLSSKGFFFQGDFSLEDLLKIWPLYCLASVIFNDSSLPLFSAKKREQKPFSLSNPLESLTKYMDYFHKALLSPSPLLPSMGKRLLKECAPLKIEDDPLIEWGINRNLIPSFPLWSEKWRSYLQEVFHELL
ncbi:MAG: exodeoxyribonuclease V subunit gamma [Candidatus Rhabdochlamydia sp.]